MLLLLLLLLHHHHNCHHHYYYHCHRHCRRRWFFFLVFFKVFDFILDREEIDFVRRIVCVLNIIGHPSNNTYTYRYAFVRWMPASFMELRLRPLDGVGVEVGVGVGVGVASIQLETITLAPLFRWADAISYYFLHYFDIIDSFQTKLLALLSLFFFFYCIERCLTIHFIVPYNCTVKHTSTVQFYKVNTKVVLMVPSTSIELIFLFNATLK